MGLHNSGRDSGSKWYAVSFEDMRAVNVKVSVVLDMKWGSWRKT